MIVNPNLELMFSPLVIHYFVFSAVFLSCVVLRLWVFVVPEALAATGKL
jgi:hypothetical protein